MISTPVDASVDVGLIIVKRRKWSSLFCVCFFFAGPIASRLIECEVLVLCRTGSFELPCICQGAVAEKLRSVPSLIITINLSMLSLVKDITRNGMSKQASLTCVDTISLSV